MIVLTCLLHLLHANLCGTINVVLLIQGRFEEFGSHPLFGRRQTKAAVQPDNASPRVELDRLITQFGQAAGFWQSQPEQQVLARARLADVSRDAKIHPASASQFHGCWTKLDAEQRLRFCILVDGLEIPEVLGCVQKLGVKDEHADAVLNLLQQLTVRLEFLTASVLQQSDIRLEEFARHF